MGEAYLGRGFLLGQSGGTNGVLSSLSMTAYSGIHVQHPCLHDDAAGSCHADSNYAGP